MKKNILNKTRKMKGFFSTILLCSLMSFFVIGNAKNNESELNDNSDVLASNENETKVVRNAPTVPAWNNPDDPEGYPSSQYSIYYNEHSYWSYGGVDDYWSNISNSMSIMKTLLNSLN